MCVLEFVDRDSWIEVLYFFFFQAEDGIRDLTVTGVQTCALPILQVLEPLGGARLLRLVEQLLHVDAGLVLQGIEADLEPVLAFGELRRRAGEVAQDRKSVV